jgi:hypothetical protein
MHTGGDFRREKPLTSGRLFSSLPAVAIPIPGRNQLMVFLLSLRHTHTGRESMKKGLKRMLVIKNNDQEITETNFWETDQAKQGEFHLSINAAAFRLLVPSQHESIIAEVETAKEVIITRGPLPDAKQEEAMEILIDDGSDLPFLIHLEANQVDRLPLPEDAGRTLTFTVWILKDGKPHCASRGECYYRTAPRLPWLKPRE